MKILLPDRTPKASRAPEGKERRLVVALVVVFLAVECWKLPVGLARLHEATGIRPLFWWCLREGLPLLIAAYVIRSAWVGKILTGLVLLDHLMCRYVGDRFAGNLMMDSTEYRDDDPRSFYFALALYFALACALVVRLGP